MHFHGEQLVSDFRNSFMGRASGDCFRFCATTFVSVLLLHSVANADLDLSISTTARSFPLSGIIEAESGYGITLWGTSGGDSPFYGFVRPRAIAGSAATYNSLDGALEVFPISFLGARAGGESIQNDDNYSDHDCENFDCKGRFYRTYVESELMLGAGPVFLQAAWRRERWTRKAPTATSFIEPTSGFALAGDGDNETVYRGLVGYKISDKWTILGALRYSEAEKTESFSRFPYGVVRFSKDDFSAGVGGGVFESSLKKPTGAGVVFLKWEPRKSVALH